MINMKLYLPIDLYTNYLFIISGINFTRREIDILTCLLSARGTSKIAHFLSISPKTVATHIGNIMLKLDCNSRERIIDFLERSGKVSMLRQYYSKLIAQSAFEKCLKSVSKLKQEAKPTCTIIWSKTLSTKDPQLDSIVTHLKLAGLFVNVEYREGHHFVRAPRADEFHIYALLSAEEENSQAQKLLSETGKHHINGIVLSLCSKNGEPNNWGRGKRDDYYLSFLEVLAVSCPR
jgi:DNA-binding CsgD family transcriptional regulator